MFVFLLVARLFLKSYGALHQLVSEHKFRSRLWLRDVLQVEGDVVVIRLLLNEVYERDDVAQEARIEARFQQLEQRVMDAIGVLTDQMAAMAVGGNPPCRHPVQPRFLKEEEVSDDISITKPLAGNHPSKGRTRAIVRDEVLHIKSNSRSQIILWDKPHYKKSDPLFLEDCLQFQVGKINLKYKLDVDKLRRKQIYKLEDEFLQAGE
ncbi:hypothetical protein RHMOL_Rhmol01G0062700 [Rhododendron molle]|uniref:Uncharacterized protein n=1 Tax=Rhododendron molle TaxID=49168 RepID=A0ACC0Q025_RHOML|nr:hypothetical protein RHMOL_Rhmol01G0062700 [Rhododendron molle]